MATRTVELTEHLEALVDGLVGTGRYHDAGEVLREGLRLVEQKEALDAARLAALQEAARVGIADLDQGRFATVGGDVLEGYIAGLGKAS